MKKITVAFIRGKYLNNFELQNYYPMLQHKSIRLTGMSSLYPLHHVSIPTERFFSPVDLPNFPYKFSLLNRLLVDAMYLWKLEKKLSGFDIAHSAETYFNFSRQVVAAKRKGLVKKVLISTCETIAHNHETIWGRKKLKQFVINGADHFHAWTDRAKRALVAEGVNEHKITTIPYGIDCSRFKPLSKKLNKKTVNILFVGRLEEEKGVRELMDAWGAIQKKYPLARLTVAGSGALKNLIQKTGLTPRYYSYNEMPRVFQHADIVVLPSKKTRFWEEQFGMVLLEAMASGVAILTTNCGAIPEVVGNAALIVQQGSGKALFRGLQQYLENPQQRLMYKERGLKRVQQYFDAQKQSEKLHRLYCQLLKKS